MKQMDLSTDIVSYLDYTRDAKYMVFIMSYHSLNCRISVGSCQPPFHDPVSHNYLMGAYNF